jgi:hypothetical protein
MKTDRMPRYKLRTLLILAAVMPAVLLITCCTTAPNSQPPSEMKHVAAYTSPVAVFDESRAALKKRDWRMYFACLTPDAQKDAIFETAFALGAGKTPEMDLDLAALVAAWPSLPPAIKAAILALINASRWQ